MRNFKVLWEDFTILKFAFHGSLQTVFHNLFYSLVFSYIFFPRALFLFYFHGCNHIPVSLKQILFWKIIEDWVKFSYGHFEIKIEFFRFEKSFSKEQDISKIKPWVNAVSLREKCLNTEFFLVLIFLYSDWITIYGVNLRIQSKYRIIRTRRNSVFGHFSRSFYKYALCRYFDK